MLHGDRRGLNAALLSLLENAAQEPTLPAACRRDAWLFLATLADQEQRPDDAADCYRRAARNL